MPAALTTHVLDLAAGRPASGMRLELWRLDPEPRRIKAATTDRDGRTSEPLLGPAEMETGRYEIVFFVGEYFSRDAADGPPPFLEEVPIRFHLSDSSSHYHVPLLATPWSYSTYRGS